MSLSVPLSRNESQDYPWLQNEKLRRYRLRQEIGSVLKGAVYGFSGDRATLQDWLYLGFYISAGLAGFVTDEIPRLQAAVREISLGHLLTETD